MSPDELIKLVSLCSNKEHLHAYEVAGYLRRGDNEAAYGIMGLFDCNPQFLKLVLDAYNGASKFEPTPTRVNIIKAWISVDLERTGPDDGRTVADVKTQYAITMGEKPPEDRTRIRKWHHDLIAHKKIPADWTIRETCREVGLPLCTDRVRRPKGRKDEQGVERKPRKDKGKSRKNSQRKSPL